MFYSKRTHLNDQLTKYVLGLLIGQLRATDGVSFNWNAGNKGKLQK